MSVYGACCDADWRARDCNGSSESSASGRLQRYSNQHRQHVISTQQSGGKHQRTQLSQHCKSKQHAAMLMFCHCRNLICAQLKQFTHDCANSYDATARPAALAASDTHLCLAR